MKKVFVIGGTGFLGYYIIQEFLTRGWEATALGLPPASPAGLYPDRVKVVLKAIDSATDEELLALLHGHDVLVFAAGMDDRVTPKKPAYPKFHHANVKVPVRVLMLAKQAGVNRAVFLGSYFAHFNRLWPEMKLAERHPYIRSRVEQEKAVTSIPGMDVDVLELPYIFGTLPVPGWKSLWTPLVKYIRSMGVLFYMKGGTACISARTVGRAVFATVERGHRSTCYPIGQENLNWPQMLGRLAAAEGRQVRVITLPTWLIHLAMQGISLLHLLQGKEGGLDLRFFAPLQTAKTYIDPALSQNSLGYELDSLDDSFRETVEACKRL